MLFDVLDKLKHQTIIYTIILIMIGLLLLVIPEQYDGTLVNILAYTLILIGSVMVWDFISREKTTLHYIVFIVALLMMLLGIYILASGDDILKILSVFFGVLLIVDGVHSAMHAWMYARRSGKKWWGLLLVLSILQIAAGITIFNNPWWKSVHSFVKVIGGVMLFASAMGLIRVLLVWPVRKKA